MDSGSSGGSGRQRVTGAARRKAKREVERAEYSKSFSSAVEKFQHKFVTHPAAPAAVAIGTKSNAVTKKADETTAKASVSKDTPASPDSTKKKGGKEADDDEVVDPAESVENTRQMLNMLRELNSDKDDAFSKHIDELDKRLETAKASGNMEGTPDDGRAVEDMMSSFWNKLAPDLMGHAHAADDDVSASNEEYQARMDEALMKDDVGGASKRSSKKTDPKKKSSSGGKETKKESVAAKAQRELAAKRKWEYVRYRFAQATGNEQLAKDTDPAVLRMVAIQDRAAKEIDGKSAEEKRVCRMSAHLFSSAVDLLKYICWLRHEVTVVDKDGKEGPLAFPNLLPARNAAIQLFAEDPTNADIVQRISDWMVEHEEDTLKEDGDKLFLADTSTNQDPIFDYLGVASIWNSFDDQEKKQFWKLPEVLKFRRVGILHTAMKDPELGPIADLLDRVMMHLGVRSDKENMKRDMQSIVSEAMEATCHGENLKLVRHFRSPETLRKLGKLLVKILPRRKTPATPATGTSTANTKQGSTAPAKGPKGKAQKAIDAPPPSAVDTEEERMQKMLEQALDTVESKKPATRGKEVGKKVVKAPAPKASTAAPAAAVPAPAKTSVPAAAPTTTAATTTTTTTTTTTSTKN